MLISHREVDIENQKHGDGDKGMIFSYANDEIRSFRTLSFGPKNWLEYKFITYLKSEFIN